MPADGLVVADTSPLLNLALIDRLDHVRDQFATVKIPEQVWSKPRAEDNEINSLQSTRDDGTIQIVTVDETPLLTEFERNLDTGEAATRSPTPSAQVWSSSGIPSVHISNADPSRTTSSPVPNASELVVRNLISHSLSRKQRLDTFTIFGIANVDTPPIQPEYIDRLPGARRGDQSYQTLALVLTR